MDSRATFVLLSESASDGSGRVSATIGGNAKLMINSLTNAMMKDPVVARVIAQAVEYYNAEKIQMN